jgi:hypothetical protein
MDTAIRFDEERISLIRAGRRKDEIQEIKIGAGIQSTVTSDNIPYEDWQRYISTQLRQPSSPWSAPKKKLNV